MGVRIRIPAHRREFDRRLDLRAWAKKHDEEIESYGDLIATVKRMHAESRADSPVNQKIVSTIALIVRDSESIDEWFDEECENAELPTTDDEWSVLWESAAWVVLQAYEREHGEEEKDD